MTRKEKEAKRQALFAESDVGCALRTDTAANEKPQESSCIT
jgi:hypothetical protein